MNLRHIVITAVVVVAASLAVNHCRQGQIDEWEQRAERALESHRITSETLTEALEQEEARADSAEARAAELEAQEPVIRERIDSVRVETPPELENHPAIVQRDSIIDTLLVQRDAWKNLYREEKEANANLRELLKEAQADADSLSDVLEDRPSARPAWLPRLGLGPHVGLCTDGKPCSGIGAHLSWELNL